jgi:hypothetical protein
MFDTIRRKTAQGPYEAMNHHRFASDIVITVSDHHMTRGWAERALQRLQEQLAFLSMELRKEKARQASKGRYVMPSNRQGQPRSYG